MKLAYSEEKKMFKGRIDNTYIWTTDIKKAIWYPDRARVRGSKMITYDEAKKLSEEWQNGGNNSI